MFVIIDHHNIIISCPTRIPTLVGVIVHRYLFVSGDKSNRFKNNLSRKNNSVTGRVYNSHYTSHEMTSHATPQLNIIYQLAHPWSIIAYK